MYVIDAARADARGRQRVTLGQGKAGQVEAGTVLTYTATGATAGAVGGPYGMAAGAVLGAAWGVAQGLMGASKSWRGFAKRLAATIQNDTSAVQRLAERVQTATSVSHIAAAVRDFNAAVGHGRRAPAGPLEVLTPPGAGGSAHEGGLVIDFEPMMAKIRQGIAYKAQALTERPGAPAAAGFKAAGIWGGIPWWVWIGGSSVLGLVGMMLGGGAGSRRRS
jgi:hypothetical protein